MHDEKLLVLGIRGYPPPALVFAGVEWDGVVGGSRTLLHTKAVVVVIVLCFVALRYVGEGHKGARTMLKVTSSVHRAHTSVPAYLVGKRGRCSLTLRGTGRRGGFGALVSLIEEQMKVPSRRRRCPPTPSPVCFRGVLGEIKGS